MSERRISRTPRLLAAATLACAVALPGSAAVATMADQFINEVYDPRELFYAGMDRDFWVIVQGNPYATPKAELDSAVISAMAQTRVGRFSNFTTTPDDSARRAYRVVLQMGGATVNGYSLCKTDPQSLASDQAVTGPVSITYCLGGTPMTQVVTTLDGVANAGDPQFESRIKQAVTALFPLNNPNAPRSGVFDD